MQTDEHSKSSRPIGVGLLYYMSFLQRPYQSPDFEDVEHVQFCAFFLYVRM